MARHFFSLLSISVGLMLCAFGAPAALSGAAVDFNRDVRPILSKNCYACHGPDGSHRTTKMRLDVRASAVARLRGGGTPIVPGHADRSEAILRVTSKDPAEHMPPPETGNRLTARQVEILRRWIDQGAPYAEHWAWVKPVPAPVPAVKNREWPRNGIDAFVLARLEAEGLQPAPEADRYTLLRRASLDLRGLPPTPEEVAEFIRDTGADAYEKAVDRFLQDPAYGERWARMWLDLARYADSAGYGSDPLRPHIWPWRDWVINAFNRNLSYDQFSLEQLAGDLLPNPAPGQRIATAFHRNTMTNSEGGTDPEEFRVAAIKDRTDVTLQIWMGLTFGCAKCHNHKYDPVTQREYYQFYAFFNQTADANRADEQPTLEVQTPDVREQQKRTDERIAEVRKRQRPPSPVSLALRLGPGRLLPLPEDLPARLEIARLVKARPPMPAVPIMVERPAGQRRETHLLLKGNFLTPGEKVEAGVPAAFHPLPSRPAAGAAPNRLDMVRWLFSPENPLTARVAVNRFWAQLWGVGLVETEEDFGTQGVLPSHPELLDWLALEYAQPAAGPGKGTGPLARPWDTKALLRLMVTSATYRQSSRTRPELVTRDARNRLLARGPRFRLEAEMVRDQALAISGLLSRKVGGPSVYPVQPPGLWQAAFNGQRTWATSSGVDRYRRGLYTFWRRTVPYPSMATFDAPSRETCTVRRSRTNTPLQAFVTLNDPVYVEAAQALARRMVREGGATTASRAAFGLTLALARPASPEQVQRVLTLYGDELAHFRQNGKAALALATEPLGPLAPGQEAAELAAWTVVANVLLNLDGVLTKG